MICMPLVERIQWWVASKLVCNTRSSTKVCSAQVLLFAGHQESGSQHWILHVYLTQGYCHHISGHMAGSGNEDKRRVTCCMQLLHYHSLLMCLMLFKKWLHHSNRQYPTTLQAADSKHVWVGSMHAHHKKAM
jgi:hypothetical protein